MSELSSLKAELKLWEKQFKASHGREPSKDDIKQVPDIAEKYKIYSKARSGEVKGKGKGKERLYGGTAVHTATAAPVTPRKKAPSSILPAKGTETAANGLVTPGQQETAASTSDATRVNYAFAPSPSKLRSLAASRSFTGSPNTTNRTLQTSNLASTPTSKDQLPPNLGRSFVLPISPKTKQPAADTPRTKAKRWLAGDEISPFKKSTDSTTLVRPQLPEAIHSKTTNRSRSDVNRTNEHASFGDVETASSIHSDPKESVKVKVARRKNGFWEQIELEKGQTDGGAKSPNNIRVDRADAGQDDWDEVMAPSPIKSLNKYKTKQLNTLTSALTEAKNTTSIGLPSDDEEMAEDDITMNRKSAEKKHKMISTTQTTLQMHKRQKTPNPSNATNSKGKKRTLIKTSALMPFDTFADESAEERLATSGKRKDSLLPPETMIPERSRSKSPIFLNSTAAKAKKRHVQADDMVYKSTGSVESLKPVSKRPKTEDGVAGTDSTYEELDTGIRDRGQMSQDEQEYDTQYLSDEYEDYTVERFRSKSAEVPRQSEGDSLTSEFREEVELDDSLDPHLVSLLSLQTSPVKNHRIKLHQKREEAVKRLLREPSYVLKASRTVRGLEDLEDELAESGESESEQCSDVFPQRQPDKQHKYVESDDDWASENEGWKDLGDGEMDDFEF